MSLTPPVLDDRTFQELVDDAKNFVRARCPEWTDHNVSDPGVTLIETFAWMMDVLIYRLNRVPDRQYVTFLRLVGVELFPPTAAKALVSFRLSAHQDDSLRVAAGTEVSTRRVVGEDSVHFRTVADAEVVPAVSETVLSVPKDGEVRDLTGLMNANASLDCFAPHPAEGDALYIGLDRNAPGNIVLIQFQCEEAAGHGIDPLHPPLRWQAWNGSEWAECPVEVDETRGLNGSGPVEIHLPARHEPTYVAERRGNWLRCVVVGPGRYTAYRDTPKLRSVTAATIGVDVEARHAREVRDEVLGESSGLPGQVFTLEHAPVLASERHCVAEVSGEEWACVESFADSGATDRHFTVDATTGELRFGPAVRTADGPVAQHGAVPPKGAPVRLRSYLHGGGAAGNVAARTICILRSSLPYVSRVYNRRSASGGVDGESVEEARVRGPLMLHARNRAVTLDDHATLARRAAPEIARVNATVDDQGAVRVAVVPRATESEGQIDLIELLPTEETLGRVQAYLDERRVVGSTVVVSPASYRAVTVAADVAARPGADPRRVERDALRALYGYLNPVSGGPERSGWPFGRQVTSAELGALLDRVPGVAAVGEVRLFGAVPARAERTGPFPAIELKSGDLVFSFAHEVSVR